MAKLASVSAEQPEAIRITGGEFSSDVSSYAGAGASTKATVTSGDGSTTRYYIGTPENVGRDVSNKANAGDTVVVSGDVALENVPSGVTVKNSGSGTVSVNDTPVYYGVPVLSHRHDWVVVTWVWKDDNSGVTLNIVCSEDNSHTASAEATAEKQAMGYFLDGKITAMFGTHTHIQTADEQILENGTGYITDIGMTGPKYSILGMDRDVALKRFLTALPEKYKMATVGRI